MRAGDRGAPFELAAQHSSSGRLFQMKILRVSKRADRGSYGAKKMKKGRIDVISGPLPGGAVVCFAIRVEI